LKNLENIYCRIGVSKIAGVGVIAVKNIPKGVNPFELTNKEVIDHRLIKITKKELDELPNETKKLIKDFLTPEYGTGDVYVPYLGMNSLDISFYMNHSDNNNVSVVLSDATSDFYEFRTNKVIKKGTELTINYDDYVDKL